MSSPIKSLHAINSTIKLYKKKKKKSGGKRDRDRQNCLCMCEDLSKSKAIFNAEVTLKFHSSILKKLL